MFEPNSTGKLRTRTGRDVHGRGAYGAERDCPFAPVNLAVGAQKTSVRVDSSASRGAADETVAVRAKILVPTYVSLKIGDLFIFDGVTYEIAATHGRRSVMGALDHYEVDMELFPA